MKIVIKVQQIVVVIIHHQEYSVRCYNLPVSKKNPTHQLSIIFIEQQRLSSSSPLSNDIKLSTLDPGHNQSTTQNRHYCTHPDCNKVRI